MSDQSTWAANPFLINATMQRNIEFLVWKTLILETFELNVWTQILVAYSKLTYIHSEKADFCAYLNYRYVYINFPFLFSFLSFCPTQRTTQLRLLVFIQITNLWHGLKKNSTNIYSTQFKWILIFYVPLYLQVGLPPSLSLIFNINPL